MMKTQICIYIFLVLAFAGKIHSQKRLQIGVQVGAIYAKPENLFFSSTLEIEPEMSIGWGVKASYKLSKRVDLNLGVFSATRKHRVIFDNTILSPSFENYIDFALEFVDAPIHIDYVLKYGFYIQSGIQIGRLSSVKNKYHGVVNTRTNNFKEVSYELLFGLGWKSPVDIVIEVRYIHGLTNLSQPTYNTYNTRNFQLMLTYPIFRIGSERSR